MFACVPITALCRTASILNRPKIPNDPSRSQQMAGREDGSVTVTQMYETQANRERGREMQYKNAHLMLSTGDLVCLPGVCSGGKPASAGGGIPTSSGSSRLQNHSPPLRGHGHSFDWKWVMLFSLWWRLFIKLPLHPSSPREKCDCKQWLLQFISPSTAKGKELYLQPLLRNPKQNTA